MANPNQGKNYGVGLNATGKSGNPEDYSWWQKFKAGLPGGELPPVSAVLGGQKPTPSNATPTQRYNTQVIGPQGPTPPAHRTGLIQDNGLPLPQVKGPNVMSAPKVMKPAASVAAPKPVTPAPATPTPASSIRPSALGGTAPVAQAPAAKVTPTAGYTPQLNVPKTLGAGPLVPTYTPTDNPSPNFGRPNAEAGFPSLPGLPAAAAAQDPNAPVASLEEGIKQFQQQAGKWWDDVSKGAGDVGQRLMAPSRELGGMRPMSWILAGMAQMADKQGQPGAAAMNVLGKMEEQFKNLPERQIATGEKSAQTQAKHVEYQKEIADVDARLKSRELSDRDRQFNAELRARLQIEADRLEQSGQQYAWQNSLELRKLHIEAMKQTIALRQLVGKEGTQKVASALRGGVVQNVYGAKDGEMDAALSRLGAIPGMTGATGSDGKPLSMFTEFMRTSVQRLRADLATGPVSSSWNKDNITQDDFNLYIQGTKGVQLDKPQQDRFRAVERDLKARALFMAQQTYAQLVPEGASVGYQNKANPNDTLFNP